MAYKQLGDIDTETDESRLLESSSWKESSAVLHFKKSWYLFLGAITLLIVFLGLSNVAMIIRLVDLKQSLSKNAYSAIRSFSRSQHWLIQSQWGSSQWKRPGKRYKP